MLGAHSGLWDDELLLLPEGYAFPRGPPRQVVLGHFLTSPNAGRVTASPPPHPRRWAPAPSSSESTRGPPRLPRRQLRRPWARCGLGRSGLSEDIPATASTPDQNRNKGGRGERPQWPGIPKGWRPPPPLRPQGRIGKWDAPRAQGRGCPPLKLSPNGRHPMGARRPTATLAAGEP